ncbi:hypothetical protein [Streptomyces chattanoogensis]|uniref:Ig-like domain-containing protein n=1 Tax=Streptomyces chattanoogensis TaxID=66876 RepID=A0A0N0XX15_9ACTN|nr:hypothetical protein [Streptomyces chattanoogensis]KPC64276.1 hypothetical protein ADL29_12155 [Streptomyces chattanoogensis]
MRAAFGVTTLLLAGLAGPATATAEDTPLADPGTLTCLTGNIDYTYSPPITRDPHAVTVHWSGGYQNCTSPDANHKDIETGSFQGSTVVPNASCIGSNVVAQGLEEDDTWNYVNPPRTSTSKLVGKISALPRADGNRVFTWAGDVTQGTFQSSTFSGTGEYNIEATNPNTCLTGISEAHGKMANFSILPAS